MTHRHKLSGQKLRILEQRANGSGLFEDATGRVVCNMALVEQDNEYCAQHGAPAFQPGLKIRAGSE